MFNVQCSTDCVLCIMHIFFLRFVFVFFLSFSTFSTQVKPYVMHHIISFPDLEVFFSFAFPSLFSMRNRKCVLCEKRLLETLAGTRSATMKAGPKIVIQLLFALNHEKKVKTEKHRTEMYLTFFFVCSV